MSTIPVAVQADIDQDKARLRDLVAEARRHHHNGCTAPDQCPGRGVAVRLVTLPQRIRDELLLIAISQLASGRPRAHRTIHTRPRERTTHVMTVEISAAFTKKERELNGLNSIVKELLDQPLERRYAVVQYESPSSKRDNREGTQTPAVKFLHIEPTTEDDDTETVKALLLKLYRKRINNEDAPPPVDETLFDSEPE